MKGMLDTCDTDFLICLVVDLFCILVEVTQ